MGGRPIAVERSPLFYQGSALDEVDDGREMVRKRFVG